MKIIDVYDLRARVLPMLLCLLPALLALWSVFGDQQPWWKNGASLLLACGIIFLLSRIARDAGKRIENRLFEAWSGPPSTQLLRHRDTKLDVHSKRRLHEQLGTLTGLRFPTAKGEAQDPSKADEVYRSASKWLISKTRDTNRFPLLFKENIHFGFQRNALGLRWVGTTIALATSLILAAHVGIVSTLPPYLDVAAAQKMTSAMSLAMLVAIALLAVWVFAITPSAARRTAFAYAERLLEAAETLASPAKVQPPKSRGK